MTHLMRTASGLALAAAASMLATSAFAADLGGNCCTDLEERVAELEATTVRKGNRKVSLQVYGQVSEAVIWWNDGAESNVYVQENNWIKNTLGFQGNAKITSDWSAGFKLELQVRAYRSSSANQLALGASNNLQIVTYNTQAISARHAYWYLQSNAYGRITVGRDVDSAVGTSTITLVNPDGFSGLNGPGFANGGFFLRRAGTTGNAGLSQQTWQNFSWIRNGDGPAPFDYSQTKGLVKYTSPFFLGQTKSSGFQFAADWGADDAWSTALRFAEEFGSVRFAAGVGYSNWRGPDRNMCSTGASGNLRDAGTNNPVHGGTNPQGDLGSAVNCDSFQASASLLHVPTGLFVSGGGGMMTDHNSGQASLARTNGFQGQSDGRSSAWWIMGGWEAKLNPLGKTIFWGQYVDFNTGLGVNQQGQTNLVQQVAANDTINSLGTAAIIRGSSTQSWGLGVSQNVDAAAMTLYAGFHNVSTEGTLGSTTSSALGKTNPIDDMQIFYTGATIRF